MPHAPYRLPLLACVLTALAPAAPAQQYAPQQHTPPQYGQPSYRMPVQQPATPARQVVDPQVTPASATMPPGATRPAGLEESPFNIYEVPGEHPLMPCIRLARQGQQEIRANVRGYSAILTKQERIDGVVGPPQTMHLKVRHDPLSVYVKFINPYPGREVLYNAGRSKTKLIAMEGSGWKRNFGKVKIPVDGRLAMEGQRYNITNTGMLYLTEELLKVAQADTKYGECEVKYGVVDIADRPCTMIRVEHPVPRSNFRFNVARIFIDHEHRIPTGYDAYTWPAEPGGKPILEESYFHTNVELNPGFTEADFDENNPNLFQ